MGKSYKTTLSNLNKIHNRALRYITKLPYRTNIDQLFTNANLLKINELYKFTASKYMFKLLYNNGPKNDMQLLSEIHTHNTRQSKNKNVFVSNLLSSNLSKRVITSCSKTVVLKLFVAHFATFPNFAAHLDQSVDLFWSALSFQLFPLPDAL